MADAGVVRRKTAQPHGGTHVHEGVNPAHARRFVGQHASHRKHEIHTPQTARGLGNARGEFGVFHRARRLGSVNLKAAQAHHGQHRHHQQHDAQTTQILQKTAPHIDRSRQVVQTTERGGTGGGQPAHGLEVGFDPGDVGHGVHQGNGGKGRQHQPHQVHQQKTVTRLQLATVLAGERPQQQATDQGQRKTGGPHLRMLIGVQRQRPAQWHKKGRGKRNQNARKDTENGQKAVHARAAV